MTDYCASKLAAVGLTEALRNELRTRKSKLRTACINPYYIDTGMFQGVKSRIIPILKEEYPGKRIVMLLGMKKKLQVSGYWRQYLFFTSFIDFSIFVYYYVNHFCFPRFPRMVFKDTSIALYSLTYQETLWKIILVSPYIKCTD